MNISEIFVSDLFIMLQSDVKQPTQLITGDEAPQRHHLDPISASEQLLVRDFSPVAPHSTVHLVQFDQSVHPAKNMLFLEIKLEFILTTCWQRARFSLVSVGTRIWILICWSAKHGAVSRMSSKFFISLTAQTILKSACIPNGPIRIKTTKWKVIAWQVFDRFANAFTSSNIPSNTSPRLISHWNWFGSTVWLVIQFWFEAGDRTGGWCRPLRPIRAGRTLRTLFHLFVWTNAVRFINIDIGRCWIQSFTATKTCLLFEFKFRKGMNSETLP